MLIIDNLKIEFQQRKGFWVAFISCLALVSFSISYSFLCYGYRFLEYNGSVFVNTSNVFNILLPTAFYFALLIIPFFISNIVLRNGTVIIFALVGTFELLPVISASLCLTSLENPFIMIFIPAQYVVIISLAGIIHKFRKSSIATVVVILILLFITGYYINSYIQGREAAAENRQFLESKYDLGKRTFVYSEEAFAK